MKNYKKRCIFAMRTSSIFLVLIGAIGIERTCSSYSSIDVILFSVYLISALICVALGFALMVHSLSVNKLFDDAYDAKEIYEERRGRR